jgi:hypothetical protein
MWHSQANDDFKQGIGEETKKSPGCSTFLGFPFFYKFIGSQLSHRIIENTPLNLLEQPKEQRIKNEFIFYFVQLNGTKKDGHISIIHFFSICNKSAGGLH